MLPASDAGVVASLPVTLPAVTGDTAVARSEHVRAFIISHLDPNQLDGLLQRVWTTDGYLVFHAYTGDPPEVHPDEWSGRRCVHAPAWHLTGKASTLLLI